MPRNVEIKAKVLNFTRICDLAKNICRTDPQILHQFDTFYKVSTGRLKLRRFGEAAGSQLIFYNRPDTEGPKLSDYSISPVSNADQLNEVLSAALGQIGIVKKIRHLFIFEQTRIHIDQVSGLGDFMELEVVLTPDQTLQQGEAIANNLMQKLEIGKDDLISGAYLDQLTKC